MKELLLRAALWCEKLSQLKEARQPGDETSGRDELPSRTLQLQHLAIIVGRCASGAA